MNEALKNRFPFLLPINSAPSLRTVNGVGFKIYGKRDYDEMTKTYVTTHFFVILFIPILALGAYRVANAQNGGWHFLGKEPVSSFAYKYNLIVAGLAVVAGIIIWSQS